HIENADGGKVACERRCAMLFSRGGSVRGRVKVWASRATNRFQPGSYGDARVYLLGFEQAVMRRVEIFARNVEACKRETLTRGLVRVLAAYGNLAQALAQLNGARVVLNGRA